MQLRTFISAVGPALALAVALSTTAHAQIKFGVGGPITGGSAAFGAQLKNGVEQAVEDINAAGGILGQKITLSVGDDRRRSEGRRLGRQQVRRRRRQIRDRPLQFRRHHPGLGRLPGERHAGDHAGCHQSTGDRPRHVEHLSRVRPRRSAGQRRRRKSSPRSSRASASPSCTTRPPTARALPRRPARRSTPRA